MTGFISLKSIQLSGKLCKNNSNLLISGYKVNRGIKVTHIKIISPNGTMNYEESIPEKLQALEMSDHTLFYFFRGRTRVKSLSESKNHQMYNYSFDNLIVDVKETNVFNSYFNAATKHGIFKNDYFVLLKNIQDAHIVIHDQLHIGYGCKYSTCDEFCFSRSSDQFECGCRDGWKYNDDKLQCICESDVKNCQMCQMNEFYCANGKCIPSYLRCDGSDDCGDNSDEDCTILTNNCLEKNTICDGNKDCPDGSDEYGCNDLKPKCPLGSFQCLNDKCIPYEQVCNKKFDCEDESDEENCDSNLLMLKPLNAALMALNVMMVSV
ncbi:Low-density lipoprotein receptor-related protein 2 [Thelohanellus kitauei]|uniref:Low-density lipoprotein receptor-related protein 2 n=1 Tax=Thelohanellus kitauei TaxID=669202 RepID=A0A0C2N8D7_THEKT|nr:Low-density lipoprotein receptor-related protein 2 [Thelohanellus kitauei]